MSDFKICGIVQEKDIPKSKNNYRYDYQPLFDQFDRISSGSSVHVQLPKKRKVESIRAAFRKKYGREKVNVTSRTNKKEGVIDVYIIRN